MKFITISRRNISVFFRLLAFFLLGTICGSSLMVAALGYRIDELTLANQELEHQIATLTEENTGLITQLEEKIDLQKLKIETLKPVILFPENTFTHYEQEALTLEIEACVKDLLQDLKGQEILTTDYHLIPAILNDRIITISGQMFKLKVENTVIAPETSVFLQASPVPVKPD
ncbi:MAG: hypothetical protein PHT78_04200 [Desulfitobacteriaceae bacterium]|nr:hypothetical protein [Desulfitobacteriaceae bacterium]MDD4752447.1 hypothetical protein [Desulfitobacteriaceae bacterium]